MCHLKILKCCLNHIMGMVVAPYSFLCMGAQKGLNPPQDRTRNWARTPTTSPAPLLAAGPCGIFPLLLTGAVMPGPALVLKDTPEEGGAGTRAAGAHRPWGRPHMPGAPNSSVVFLAFALSRLPSPEFPLPSRPSCSRHVLL